MAEICELTGNIRSGQDEAVGSVIVTITPVTVNGMLIESSSFDTKSDENGDIEPRNLI